ncbi:hypothetical protein KAR91_48340 [Candidatus Pacearchaeota archaeon]|nr:hypothetical protein [Candidatus Pacearchaeota archaeon]
MKELTKEEEERKGLYVNPCCGHWYAIRTIKRDTWSIGTFGNLLTGQFKEKYSDKSKYDVLGPFRTSKLAEEATEAHDGLPAL